jgi:hypothetical protein
MGKTVKPLEAHPFVHTYRSPCEVTLMRCGGRRILRVLSYCLLSVHVIVDLKYNSRSISIADVMLPTVFESLIVDGANQGFLYLYAVRCDKRLTTVMNGIVN